MDRNKSSTATAFNTLPIELNKEIAHYFDDHQDIANFKAICRATSDAMDGDDFSYWRSKWCEDFARPPNKTNRQLCREFKVRWQFLRRFVTKKTSPRYQFVRGHTAIEQSIVRTLKDLINESFAGSAQADGSPPYCLNMVRLKEFVLNSTFLLGGKRPPPMQDATINVSFAAVRIMLTHFLLDQDIPTGSWFAIDDAQKVLYAPTKLTPLYLGPNHNILNVEWVLQDLNFFRYYMTTPEASGLYDAIQDLEPSQRPSAWKGPLKSGSRPLSRHWKGTYSFLDHAEIARFRKYTSSGEDADRIYTDLNVDEGKIQTLNLDFLTNDHTASWPKVFEDRLQSLRNIDATAEHARAQRSKKSASNDADANRNIRFDGFGEDEDNELFYTSGWLNPLPDQCGIPGWQRITFMKHFENELGSVNRDNLWAYEGVVLPGGRIIVGRWWLATEAYLDITEEYSGPFIFWAVEPEPEMEEDGEDNGGDE